MLCPHCNKSVPELEKATVAVAGNSLVVMVCPTCINLFEKMKAFAGTFPSASTPATTSKKAAKKPKKASPSHFDAHALSAAEIAQTQALRPTVRYRDTPQKRRLDDMDSVARRERTRVFCIDGGGYAGVRETRMRKMAQKELGWEDVVKISDNGTEAVFEKKASN